VSYVGKGVLLIAGALIRDGNAKRPKVTVPDTTATKFHVTSAFNRAKSAAVTNPYKLRSGRERPKITNNFSRDYLGDYAQIHK
jgi:hypothetical protein